MVEEDSANVVQMTIQGKEASASLIAPDLNLVIISTRNKEGLCLVKVNSPNWAIMLLKPVNQCAHSVVP
jgi:hypothetical protein